MAADHILTFAQALGPGGVEAAQLRLADAWVKAGRRVTLVVGAANGVLRDQLPQGVEVVETGQRTLPGLARALPAEVRRSAPDAVFCAGSHYALCAAWLRWRLGRRCPPIVAKLSNAVRRGDHGRVADLLHGAWLRCQPLFVDRFVAMSPASADAAAAALGVAREDVVVIANPPRLPMADEPKVTRERVILGVGRLVPQKRWDRLIGALPHLPGDVRIVILGEGPERSRLLAQAALQGTAARVSLPGHASDPTEAMASAAVLALTSDFEGVPGVIREALSVGTPVVATASSPAVAEIVATPAMGTVVARGDMAMLVDALTHWLAPGVVRPAPVPMPGGDAAARYLQLFDTLVSPSA